MLCVTFRLPSNRVDSSEPLLLEYTASDVLSSKVVTIKWSASATLSLVTLSSLTLLNATFKIEMSPFDCTAVIVASPFVLRASVNCTVSLFEVKLNSLTGALTTRSDTSTVLLQMTSSLTYTCNKTSLDKSKAGGLVELKSVVQLVVMRSKPSGSVKIQSVWYWPSV